MASPHLAASRPDDACAGPYEPIGILRWLYARFFAHIDVDERWSAAVRDASSRGVVVYVMRSLSFLDFLCLDFLTKRFGLPLVRFVNDLGLWILEPFGKGERRLRLRRQVPEDEALRATMSEEQSALLFLRRPPRLGHRGRRGEKLEIDLLEVLVDAQRGKERPIFLVPQTFVWSTLPDSHRRSLVDLLFGPREWPGRIRVLLQFLLNFRNAKLRSGEPFDLGAFVAANAALSSAEIAAKVRYALLRRMERERTLVLGPSQKSPTRIRDELLRSPRLQKHLAAEARATNRSLGVVERQARRELRKLCAAQDPMMIGLFDRVLEWVWNRIYDGLVVDRAGLERMRVAGRDATLILVPSHKSHVDYLVLSYVLYKHALSPPLIAAGENLSFFPLGTALRRAGAFFIRRSFRGKKLYAALVDAYVRKLLIEGFTVEFFVEGGRSRSGKVLPPKLGMLSMVVDSALVLHEKPIVFVPISIGYDRIVEERSYVQELEGGEKQREGLGHLLRTPRILRSRYGRLYVQFGEIIPFERALAAVCGPDVARHRAPSPPKRRALVQHIGQTIVSEISRATVVTAAALVATVALSHGRRGISRSALIASAFSLAGKLEREGAVLAPTLRDESGSLRETALGEALALFIDGRLLTAHVSDEDPIYATPDERRIALEYYKNTCLHFLGPSALIAAALRDEPCDEDELLSRAKELAELFAHDRLMRTDTPAHEVLVAALDALVAEGQLERSQAPAARPAPNVHAEDVASDRVRPDAGRRVDDTRRPGEGAGARSAADEKYGAVVERPRRVVRRAPDADRLAAYVALVSVYFESYRLTIRSLRLIRTGSTSRNAFSRRTLALGQRLYLSGTIESREALSKEKIDNALRALAALGHLELDEDTIRPSASPRAEHELDALESRLTLASEA